MLNDKRDPKSSVISATTLQRQIGSVIRRVAVNGQHLIVERGSIPVLVMLPLPDYQALVKHQLPAKHHKLQTHIYENK